MVEYIYEMGNAIPVAVIDDDGNLTEYTMWDEVFALLPSCYFKVPIT